MTLLSKTVALFDAHPGCSLALVAPDGRRFVGSKRGVADLFALLSDSPTLLRGAAVADKVVGKGAAALMALGGVSALYAATISEPALRMLRAEGLTVEFRNLVPNIINRAGTGICPVEALCLPCSTPTECLPAITNFLNHGL